jgi:hypothetical protein
MKKLRYCLQTAYESGAEERPYNVMINLGYEIISTEPIPIGSCVIFEVKEIISPLPKYLKEV